MSRRRERLQVIHDILKVIQEKGEAKPTHILYKSNLSHQLLQEYLKELKEKKFIAEEKKEEGVRYKLEEKGYAYLHKYSQITEFMESFGLD